MTFVRQKSTTSTSTTATYEVTGLSTGTSYTVYVIVIDAAGNTSSSATKTAYLDKTVPSTASLTVSSYDTSSITVSASGADATSRSV